MRSFLGETFVLGQFGEHNVLMAFVTDKDMHGGFDGSITRQRTERNDSGIRTEILVTERTTFGTRVSYGTAVRTLCVRNQPFAAFQNFKLVLWEARKLHSSLQKQRKKEKFVAPYVSSIDDEVIRICDSSPAAFCKIAVHLPLPPVCWRHVVQWHQQAMAGSPLILPSKLPHIQE
jgi:hypothetical protein